MNVNEILNKKNGGRGNFLMLPVVWGWVFLGFAASDMLGQPQVQVLVTKKRDV